MTGQPLSTEILSTELGLKEASRGRDEIASTFTCKRRTRAERMEMYGECPTLFAV